MRTVEHIFAVTSRLLELFVTQQISHLTATLFALRVGHGTPYLLAIFFSKNILYLIRGI